MIEPGDEVILFRDGRHIHVEGLDAVHVRRTGGSDWPEGKVWLNGGHRQSAHRGVRHLNTSRSGLVLPKSLVGGKNKCLVLDDRSSGGTPKLNTPKRSD